MRTDWLELAPDRPEVSATWSGLRVPPLPPPPLWPPRPSSEASCALRAPWVRMVGRLGGPPRLVMMIELGRVATCVWPAARTTISLPNTKIESV